MATYKFTGTVQGADVRVVNRVLKEAIEKAFPGASVRAEKVNDHPSRADRLAEAEEQVTDAATTVRELADEMEAWYDSIPENLQNGDKASQVEEAKDLLTELADTLENCDFSVDFPAMMG